MTIALWVTYFMGLMVIYLLTGWLPTLMKDAGLDISTAANVTAMFQIGGTIGAIIVGWIDGQGAPGVRDRGGLPGRRAVHSGGLARWACCRRAGPAGLLRRVLHERRADRPERLRAGPAIPRWRARPA